MKINFEFKTMTVKINDAVFNEFPEIESKRLLFKQFNKNDALNILSIRTDKRVSKHMDSVTPQTIEDTEKKIIEIQNAFNKQKGITWAIIDKSSGKLIGDFGIWRLDRQNSRGEIGYVLHPNYWGKDYMYETISTLVHFAFNNLNLHSLEANVNPENNNSKKLLLKLGFKKEAYFRENYYYEGDFLDSEIYCILKSDIE